MKKTQNVLKSWQIRSLILEDESVISKISGYDNKKIPDQIISELETIQAKTFFGPINPNLNTKLRIVKQKRLISLKRSWIKWLYDDSFHKWKLIPLQLINERFWDNFKLHSDLSFNNICINKFPKYYKDMILNWSQYISTIPETLPGIFNIVFVV